MTTERQPDPGAPAMRPVMLALEGGGSLGAFTWGALDRHLDVLDFRIELVSGTSAGAMNAAMLVQGMATGGPPAAEQLLEAFWRRVVLAVGLIPGPVGAWIHLVSGAMAPMVDAMRHVGSVSRPGFDRTASNPLRGILTELLDPSALALSGAPALAVAATRATRRFGR